MMFFVHVGFLLIPACLCRAFGVMFHVSSIFETFPCCLTAAGLTWNIFTHLYTALDIWLLRQDVADIFDWGPLEPRGSFFHILPHSSTFFHILPHSSTFFHILPQHVCLHSCLQCLVLFLWVIWWSQLVSRAMLQWAMQLQKQQNQLWHLLLMQKRLSRCGALVICFLRFGNCEAASHYFQLFEFTAQKRY